MLLEIVLLEILHIYTYIYVYIPRQSVDISVDMTRDAGSVVLILAPEDHTMPSLQEESSRLQISALHETYPYLAGTSLSL